MSQDTLTDDEVLTPSEALEAVEAKIEDLSKIDTSAQMPWTYKPFLHEGVRALVNGPKGAGKSIAALALALDIASQGEDSETYYFDIENGAVRTARRMEAILASRPPEAAEWARRCFHYSRLFDFRDLDDPALVAEWQERLKSTSLVVIDSLPRYLGRLGLNENDAPSISRFMTRYVDKLVTNERTSVLALDNTGHDGKRSRGSSAKEDMMELVYLASGGQTCSETRHGTITLRKIRHRDGDEADVMAFGAGGGKYTMLEADGKDADLLKAILKVLPEAPQTKNWVMAQAKEAGIKVRKQDLYRLLDDWAQDPYSGILESEDGGFGLDA